MRNAEILLESYKIAHELVKTITTRQYSLAIFWTSSNGIMLYTAKNNRELISCILFSIIGITFSAVCYLFERRANQTMSICLKSLQSIENIANVHDIGFYSNLDKRPRTKASNRNVAKFMYIFGFFFWAIFLILKVLASFIF